MEFTIDVDKARERAAQFSRAAAQTYIENVYILVNLFKEAYDETGSTALLNFYESAKKVADETSAVEPEQFAAIQAMLYQFADLKERMDV